MPYTVNSCFDWFNKNIVNLDADEVPTARTSRDTLIDSMHSLSDRGLLPKSYAEKDIPFGSFARKTKIRPLDDIDIMICFSGCGGTWKYAADGNTIEILMPANAPVLSEMRNDNGSLNSRKLIEKIKGELRDVRYYKKADIHRNQEAATLQLSSYDWNFDLVPCFYATADFYLIPDGNGNWKKTDPRIDQQRVTTANQIHNGQLLQLIRTMKYWKTIWWGGVSSYMFEQMIINGASFINFNQPFANIVAAIINYLSSAILGTIADPKGMQGDLNQLDLETRRSLSNIAIQCCRDANTALFEESYYRNSSAIAYWRKVFGNQFPQYGGL